VLQLFRENGALASFSDDSRNTCSSRQAGSLMNVAKVFFVSDKTL